MEREPGLHGARGLQCMRATDLAVLSAKSRWDSWLRGFVGSAAGACLLRCTRTHSASHCGIGACRLFTFVQPLTLKRTNKVCWKGRPSNPCARPTSQRLVSDTHTCFSVCFATHIGTTSVSATSKSYAVLYCHHEKQREPPRGRVAQWF